MTQRLSHTSDNGVLNATLEARGFTMQIWMVINLFLALVESRDHYGMQHGSPLAYTTCMKV